MVLISLITTSVNSDFLLQAALSVRSQFFNDFEWILLIDGVEYVTPYTLNWIQDNIPQARVIIREHQGRNKALIDVHTFTKYPYIGWLDDDDLLHPLCLQRCFDVIKLGYQAVYTNCYYMDKDSKVNTYHIQNLYYCKSNLLRYFCAFHFRLYARSIYDAVGGIDPNYKYSMDYELTLRMATVTDFYHIQEPLYYYRTHPNNISTTKKVEQATYHKKAFDTYRKIYETL